MGTYSQFRLFNYSKYQRLDRDGVTLDDISQALQTLDSEEMFIHNPFLDIQGWKNLLQQTRDTLEERDQPFHLTEVEMEEEIEGTYRWEVKATDALIYLLSFPTLQLCAPEPYEPNLKAGTTFSMKGPIDFMPVIDFFILCENHGGRHIKTINGGCYLLLEELTELTDILQNIQNTFLASSPISKGRGDHPVMIRSQEFLTLIASAQQQNLTIAYEVNP